MKSPYRNYLASLIRQKLDFAVTIPEYLEEIILKAGAKFEEVKQPKVEETKIDWSPLLADLKSKIDYYQRPNGKDRISARCAGRPKL